MQNVLIWWCKHKIGPGRIPVKSPTLNHIPPRSIPLVSHGPQHAPGVKQALRLQKVKLSPVQKKIKLFSAKLIKLVLGLGAQRIRRIQGQHLFEIGNGRIGVPQAVIYLSPV